MKPVKPEAAAWTYRIGKRVAQLRDRRGWSQDGLAEGAGVVRKTISDLENGNRSAGITTLVSALLALDVDIWKLFGGSSVTAPKLPPQHQVLHDMVDEVIATGRNELIESTRLFLRALPRTAKK